MIIQEKIDENIIKSINSGGIGVLATDTIYGLVASALQKESVERIYEVRQRDSGKPMIILISSLEDLEIFNVEISDQEKKKISSFWPGKVSVMFSCFDDGMAYLHRGKNSLAFRWPDKGDLEELIRKTGPLVAPSANISGYIPARNIREAQKYFGEKIDFYVDGGEIVSEASTLVRVIEEKIIIERQGAYKMPSEYLFS
jgi:L-threonylcarbamoyladenylate synthase